MEQQATGAERDLAIGDIRFHVTYKPSKEDPNKLDKIEMVDWLKLGDSMGSRTTERVSRLKANPQRGRPAAIEWSVIERYYDAWKKGEEMPVDGTPLAAWPGCDPQLAEILKQRQVRTVEEFANLPDHYVGSIPLPDIRVRMQAAKKFVENQASTSDLRDQIAELKALVAKQAEGPTEPVKRRGRPPKVKEPPDDVAYDS